MFATRQDFGNHDNMIENMKFIEIDDNITPKATQQNFHKLPDLKMSN